LEEKFRNNRWAGLELTSRKKVAAANEWLRRGGSFVSVSVGYGAENTSDYAETHLQSIPVD
jgi:hypothetical protein